MLWRGFEDQSRASSADRTFATPSLGKSSTKRPADGTLVREASVGRSVTYALCDDELCEADEELCIAGNELCTVGNKLCTVDDKLCTVDNEQGTADDKLCTGELHSWFCEQCKLCTGELHS